MTRTGPRSWWKAARAIVRSRVRAWRIAARNRAVASHCFYCGVAFEGLGNRQRTVDHRVPSAAGGSNRLGNLVFACRACNQRKGSRPEDEFLASAWLARRRTELGSPSGPSSP